MQLTCQQSDLYAALRTVGRAVATRTTLSILENVLLTTDAGRLKLTATNLDRAIVAWIDAEIVEEGEITLPAKLLTEIVGSLPAAPITITAEPGQPARLTCGRTRSSLHGYPAEDYPIIPILGEAPGLSLPAPLLAETVSQVLPAVASDDIRPVLAGILFHAVGEDLTLAAANGFCMARRTVQIPEIEHELQVIVPGPAMGELARIAAAAGDVDLVHLAIERNQLVARLPDVQLSSRTIAGNFPQHGQIIPAVGSGSTRATVERLALLSAVKLAHYVARDDAHQVRLGLSVGAEDARGTLRVESATAGLGDSVQEIGARLEGEPLKIAFDARFLTDALSVMPTSEVVLELSGATTAGVVRPWGGIGNALAYAIMPMYVRGGHD